MYPNIAQVVARADAGIASVADLAGKRVGTGAPGSGFELFSVRLLTAAGIDPETGVERVKLSTQDTYNAMRDGKIDAMVFVGGTPVGGMTDLLTGSEGKYVFLPLDDYLGTMNDAHANLYSAQSLPAGTYPGQSETVSTMGVWNLLVANAGLSDADAKAMCGTIFDNLAQFRTVHPVLSQLDIDRQLAANTPVPLHPGALECFAERGHLAE
jgi:TRAP transporter TAXI family solute receptor